MPENPYLPPATNTMNTEPQGGLPTAGMVLFLVSWLSIYLLLLIWGYFSNIPLRQEYPSIANTELHPLRIAFNMTISLLPILLFEPWAGNRLGKLVVGKAKEFWGQVFLLALLIAAIQGAWVILVDLARRLFTGSPTGNEPMFAAMGGTFFVISFMATAAVHSLLGLILLFRWRRRPNPSFNSDAAATG